MWVNNMTRKLRGSCSCGLSRRLFGIAAASVLVLDKRAHAQVVGDLTIPPGGACWNAGAVRSVSSKIATFTSSAEANDLVGQIVKVVGLQPNFDVLAGAVSNAVALFDRPTGKRYIVYSEAWLQTFLAATRNKRWAGVGLLAHEIGHHLNGDSLDGIGSQPPRELKADYFAGFVIGRMGGGAQDAQACFELLNEMGSATHPPRADRIEASVVGWRSAQGSSPSTPTQQSAPSTAYPRWLGAQFEKHGKTCRIGERLVDGKPVQFSVCRGSDGIWYED